jgi:hypothetical protein
MKKILFLLAALGHFFCAQAQHPNKDNDSLNTKKSAFHEEDCNKKEWRELIINASLVRYGNKIFFGGNIRVIAEQPKVFFDIRMAMPHGPTATIGVGYPIRLRGDNCWVLSPALYLHAGTFSGISPGFVMRYDKDPWFIITSNQFLFSIEKENNHHFFSVTTFDYKLTKWLDIGAELEILYGKKNHVTRQIETNMEYLDHVETREFLFGPQVRFIVKHNYIELTLMQNVLHKNQQTILIGYVRPF